MKQFFKTSMQPIVDILDKMADPSSDELVAQIHADFDTEVDKLLEWAKIKRNADVDLNKVQKRDKLVKLGFTSSKNVKEGDIEIERANKVVDENLQKERLIEAVGYFGLYYHQKFITIESVLGLCKKYGLILGDTSKYIGTIPDKNLCDIESFQLRDVDKVYVLTQRSASMSFAFSTESKPRLIGHEEYMQRQSAEMKDRVKVALLNDGAVVNSIEEMRFDIVAPVTDFDTKGMDVKNYQLQAKPIPDPIVLAPVMYKGFAYYLIVTAWGPEASDADVVNEKNQ